MKRVFLSLVLDCLIRTGVYIHTEHEKSSLRMSKSRYRASAVEMDSNNFFAMQDGTFKIEQTAEHRRKKVERNRNVMKRNAHSGLFIFVGNKHQLRSLVRLHTHSLTRSFVHVNLNALMLLSFSIRLLFFHFPFNCVFLTFGGLFFFFLYRCHVLAFMLSTRFTYVFTVSNTHSRSITPFLPQR